ncbi:hypothetical protein PR202_ga03738 [Eleusine coracana subsp. coracana]|uniref:AAA+ ATPase domain-containing protein n=1 Tax=Eleusine coracana subsp. coracana TaxID=191504 RepID=A0AAV5BMX1_ELECO|nr:hypothetical protein PR202_ga03738 [Eleusine coracana subsp. coracana]
MPEAEWNDERTRIICELFVEQVRTGNRPNTHLNNIGYRIVASKFQQRTGLLYTKMQLKNKWDKFKSDYITWKKLLIVGSGLRWDNAKRTFAADDDWWKKINKELPGARRYRNAGIQNEDKLKIMFDYIDNNGVDPSPQAATSGLPSGQDNPRNGVDHSPQAATDGLPSAQGNPRNGVDHSPLAVDGLPSASDNPMNGMDHSPLATDGLPSAPESPMHGMDDSPQASDDLQPALDSTINVSTIISDTSDRNCWVKPTISSGWTTDESRTSDDAHENLEHMVIHHTKNLQVKNMCSEIRAEGKKALSGILQILVEVKRLSRGQQLPLSTRGAARRSSARSPEISPEPPSPEILRPPEVFHAMAACATRRLFRFPLPAPMLPLLPAPSPLRRRRGAWAGAARCTAEASGAWGGIVEDDLSELLQVYFCFTTNSCSPHILPRDLRDNLQNEPRKDQLLEIILDLGRRPEARFLGDSGGEYLRDSEISQQELEEAQRAVGEFGGDNRAGIEGTLHRISAIRSRKGMVVGLTCRVGRAVTGHVDMVRDLLNYKESILFLGRPGVGKTTVMREIARVLADEFQKRVVIVDTSNEIGGDGDIPHAAIGGARRMQVPEPSMQHRVMIEAVENHMPEVVIVDEIGTEAEAQACRSIAERGVMLIGTAHGERLANIIKNPILSDLIGGVETVTLGDDEARARRSQKSILERKAPPTFPFLIEMRERHYWVTHRTERSVDMLLNGKKPLVEMEKNMSQRELLVMN